MSEHQTFGYVEPGGRGHFPLDTPQLVTMALARASSSPYGARALPAIMEAAKRFGLAAGRGYGEDVERRFTGPGAVYQVGNMPSAQLRAGPDGRPRIGGLASVFRSMSLNLGGFTEVIEPSAFNEARADEWPGVVARFNHSMDFVLGTTASGTLSLKIDRRGLDYEVLPPASRADVTELVERGDCRHSSFAFRLVAGVDDEWERGADGVPVRHVHNLQLVDVAPVISPAYPNATAGLRSLAQHFDMAPAELDELAKRGETWRLWRLPPRNPIASHSTRAALIEARADPWDAEDGPLNPEQAIWDKRRSG